MKEDPKLNNADKSLLNAASTGEGLVALTPELLKSMGDNLRQRNEHVKTNWPKLIEDCDYETKLAIVAWTFGHIIDHATEGGSFRYLIYDRMGFGSDAYVPLYNAGGMTISNEFILNPEGPTT